MSLKKFMSLLLALCIVCSSFMAFTVSAAQTDVAPVAAVEDIAEVSASYGLAKNIQDGTVLHCFDWKYNDIKAELKNIAAAGFTSVQTSPAQPAGSGEWYWLYQPYGFSCGSNALGSKSELQALCTEADKYGIKVIVDVVANHLNGDTGRVQEDLRDGQYWHNHGGVSNWADRYQVIMGEIGMRDLNSEHSYVQQKVSQYINELKGIGVDGIRWDAAKHIGLPSEGCNFWPAVTNNGLYHYGEILVGPDDRGSGNEHLMVEYTKYMTVTDSSYGMTLRESFNSGRVPESYGNWCNRGVAANKLIYWGESHDTWSNGQDWGYSNGMNQNVIDRAYAVAASRNGASALYFSRPSSSNKSSIHSGQKGSTHFTSPEVAAVNHFHNEMIGQKDYYATGNNCAVICREGGAVIVAGSGGNFSVNVPNGGSTTKPGTYTDEITGNKWTVTSSTISGTIGSSGIAVIYNPQPDGPEATVTPGSHSYRTDTLKLTLNFSNATSGQYSINGGAYTSFTNGQTITIGSGVAYGATTTVSVKALNGSTASDINTYKYTKVDPNASGIYFDNSSTRWSQVYCYIYKDGSTAPADWPGTKMTSQGSNMWFMDVPAGYENCSVLFTDNNGNQIPGANEPGLAYTGTPKVYKNNSWQDYAPLVVVIPTQKVTEPVITPDPTPDPDTDWYLRGDADLSGVVNIKDASAIQKHLASLESITGLALKAANVDNSTAVNVKDASLIQKYVAGIDNPYKIGSKVSTSGTVVEPTEPVEPTPVPTPTQPVIVPSNKNVVYFKNTSNWGAVHAYVWSSAGGELAAWPGTQMTCVSGNIFKIELDKKYDMIIFSTSGNNQTKDLTIPGNGYIYDYSSGSWPVYTAGGNTSGGSSSGGSTSGGTTSGNVTIRFVDTNNWGTVRIICWKNNASNKDEFTMQSVGNNTFSISISPDYDKIYFTCDNQWSQHFDMPKNGGTYTYNQGWS